MPPEKKKVADKENYLTDAAIYGKNRTYVRYGRKKTKNGKNRSLRWWRRMDSNHRSRRQQIYSLPPLATREIPHIIYEIGAGGRIRTPDLLITNQLLYQLSYTSVERLVRDKGYLIR